MNCCVRVLGHEWMQGCLLHFSWNSLDECFILQCNRACLVEGGGGMMVSACNIAANFLTKGKFVAQLYLPCVESLPCRAWCSGSERRRPCRGATVHHIAQGPGHAQGGSSIGCHGELLSQCGGCHKLAASPMQALGIQIAAWAAGGQSTVQDVPYHDFPGPCAAWSPGGSRQCSAFPV